MNRELEKRIELTSQCRDSDVIPKVTDAGKVYFDAERQKEYQVMHNGLKVYSDSHYGDFNTKVISKLLGHHEPQEEKVFFEVLKYIPKNGLMIEVGSFWAYYSMWFAKEVVNARNFMIEPMVVHHGRENFELNGMRGGDFTEACIGRESQEICEFEHWDGSVHKIRQVALDDFVEAKKIEHVDILHADIQGAEREMLLGASKVLAGGKIDFVFVSTHGMRLHEDCLEILLSNGYEVITEHSPLQSFSVDGLIAMRHREVDFPTIEVSKNRQRPLKQWTYRVRRTFRQGTRRNRAA